MKVTYDPEADALNIRFRAASIDHSDPLDEDEDFIADYDADGSIVGLEILDASEHLDDPGSLEFLTLRGAHQADDPDDGAADLNDARERELIAHKA